MTPHLSQSEGSILSTFSDLARNHGISLKNFAHLESKTVRTALLKIYDCFKGSICKIFTEAEFEATMYCLV